MHLCLRQTAFTLALQAKRSGESEGARRKATGRVRGDRMYVYCRVSQSRAELSLFRKEAPHPPNASHWGPPSPR
jgi:hypothetical protein